ncbi:hypothetical protein BDR05DRAFT_1001010 [Suillus weaverae]|nr:hypothetical protein BDR05DRAFT_1001010 [Suillus weaverae]
MTKKNNNIKATQARAACWPKKPTSPSHSQAEHSPIIDTEHEGSSAHDGGSPSAVHVPIEIDSDENSESGCGYLGGVNADYSGSDSEYEPDTSESEWSDDESLCEFWGDDLEENLAALRAKAESLHGHPMPTVPMFEKKTVAEWEKAEWNRALGYNGHSGQTKRRHDKAARELAEYHEKRKTSNDPQVTLMRTMFACPRFRTPSPSCQTQNSNPPDFKLASHGLCYLSDESNSDNGTESDGDDSDSDGAAQQNDQPAVLALKQHKLDVPYCEQRQLVKETQLDEMKKALTSIEKLLKAKKNISYLTMVIKMKWLSIDASWRAAESHGFAANWGDCQVCSWTRLWVADRKLPESLQGRHAKVYSLLGDPMIATKLQAYVRSNKIQKSWTSPK